MHELPIVKSIFKSVNSKANEVGAKRVSRVVIEAGELREFVEVFLQKYWDYVSVGTPCEGAKIELVSLPATVKCGSCGRVYTLDVERLEESKCPDCGFDRGELLTGRELKIKGMEIE